MSIEIIENKNPNVIYFDVFKALRKPYKNQIPDFKPLGSDDSEYWIIQVKKVDKTETKIRSFGSPGYKKPGIQAYEIHGLYICGYSLHGRRILFSVLDKDKVCLITQSEGRDWAEQLWPAIEEYNMQPHAGATPQKVIGNPKLKSISTDDLLAELRFRCPELTIIHTENAAAVAEPNRFKAILDDLREERQAEQEEKQVELDKSH